MGAAVDAPGEEANEDEVNIEGDEEVEPLRTAPSPQKPSAKEVEDHRTCHIPFRCWCKWCIMGRGRGIQHRASPGSHVPIIGLDYFFMTRGGIKKRDELKVDLPSDAAIQDARMKGGVVKCIIVRCMQSKILFAHCIPCKGIDEDQYVTGLITDDLEWLGHTRMIIKADNEPALQALVSRSLEAIRVR